ncbi:MFS transporter [Lewinella sp. 4G2]|uniref:MFS transporter n=1 Tax=Lewinella sp. 4G2 TaxID=1803372 RepID=UPI0007B46AD1|nr:MFS transporter [Lewinella sp. 4G2]OAV43590.1 hypothetical protein A3850_003355 [Lewinella sp. 4G2]
MGYLRRMPATLRLSLLQWTQNSTFACVAITLGTYLLRTLEFSGREVGMVYASAAIAATVSPPITGWLADKHFSADRMLVYLNLFAAVALTGCFFVDAFLPFYGLILLFNLCFMPTFSLLSSVCFHQLERPSEQFPAVRTWGTVGFTVVGFALGLLGWEPTAWPLLLGVGYCLLTATLAWGLDEIPPQPGFSWSDVGGEEVKQIFREPGMLVLMVAMLLSCIPSAFYYSFVNPFLTEIGWSAAAAKMSIGNVGEVFILLSLPFVLRKVRFRRVVFWGLFLWGARYLAFMVGRPGHQEWLLYAGIMVQGICFVWIVVAAQIYVDNRVPKSLRSTAQGLIVFANQGVGMILGSWLAGEVVNAYALADGSHDWAGIWVIPGTVGVVAALGFWAWFPRDSRFSILDSR